MTKVSFESVELLGTKSSPGTKEISGAVIALPNEPSLRGRYVTVLFGLDVPVSELAADLVKWGSEVVEVADGFARDEGVIYIETVVNRLKLLEGIDAMWIVNERGREQRHCVSMLLQWYDPDSS
jgi:hypothetical protein